MSNNKLKQNYHKKSFFRCTLGSVAIVFAIMLPAMLISMLVSINYVQEMRDRARLSEATNEASLAIVALNNKNIDAPAIEQNRKIALNYINYSIYQKINDDLVKNKDATIDIKYDRNKKIYSVVYKQKFDFLTSDKGSGKGNGSEQSMIVGNKTNTYGNTKKFERRDSFDIAFISDFSGSVTCKYRDTSCNAYSETHPDTQRLKYMKKAIGDIIDKFKQYPEYKFALVPYDIGVPVQQNNKNPAGGESYGCSVMYKMKSPYDQVDYSFWANKNIAYRKWSNLKAKNIITDYLTYNYFDKFKNTVYYNLDYFYYRYYSQLIGPALGYDSDKKLVDSGLCTVRHRIEQLNMGSARYACGKNNADYPLKNSNKRTVEDQYAKVVQLYDYMFSGDHPDVHYSFANTKTVDVQGTIDTLFSDINTNTITFNRSISPTVADFSPFQGMCQSPLYNNGIMSKSIAEMKKNHKRFAEAAKKMKKFKLSPYLVPFSQDENHNANLLNSIKKADWKPGGGTDTITALLRTVPVMARGGANNKIMIIITDGKDDSGADILRDQFLDAGVCQTITSGLTSLDNKNRGYIDMPAETATIHYIKIDPRARNLTTNSEYEAAYGKWFTKCMNENKQYLHEVQDYQSLYDTMEKIILSETGNFVNKNKNKK
ncbi:hypothetical protein GQ597_02120 [Gilliamella sp. Pra-s65]|uniref:TadE/TadG family type IV pilus assembly protein n=1 Tax=unclassified Gilliamella TaxID=2685620 RepID=UPI001365E8BC|nr:MULTISPECIES: pilus assembly protein [unclassified Gilliamella]MWN89511.1 hypothetical protein [Gilliamella sp. Pra-s65]MWP72519.1 hypothetical protein [Gilliamella sp. Pra-s52]